MSDSEDDCEVEVIVPRPVSEYGYRLDSTTPRLYIDPESTTPASPPYRWATVTPPPSQPEILLLEDSSPRYNYKHINRYKRAKSGGNPIRKVNKNDPNHIITDKSDMTTPSDEDTKYALWHRGFHRPSTFVIARYPTKYHGKKMNLTTGPVNVSNHKLPPSFKPRTRYGRQAVVVTHKDKRGPFKHWPTPPLFPNKPRMKDAACDCQIMEWHEKEERGIQAVVYTKNKQVQFGNPRKDSATQYPRIRQKDVSLDPMEIKRIDRGIQNVPETRDAMEETSVSIIFHPDPVTSVREESTQTFPETHPETTTLTPAEKDHNELGGDDENEEYEEPNLRWEKPVYAEEVVHKPPPAPKVVPSKKESSPYKEIQFPVDTKYPVLQSGTKVVFNDKVEVYSSASEEEDNAENADEGEGDEDVGTKSMEQLSLNDTVENSYIN